MDIAKCYNFPNYLEEKKIKIYPGLPPEYKRTENFGGQNESHFSKYQFYKKLNSKPCTQHCMLKSKEEIHSFFAPVVHGSRLHLDLFFDLSLAQIAYDSLVVQQESQPQFSMNGHLGF